jgi:hypothetical protein
MRMGNPSTAESVAIRGLKAAEELKALMLRLEEARARKRA